MVYKVCQWLMTGRWFSLNTAVSSTNTTNLHDITEILLKVALNTKPQTQTITCNTLSIWNGLRTISFKVHHIQSFRTLGLGSIRYINDLLLEYNYSNDIYNEHNSLSPYWFLGYKTVWMEKHRMKNIFFNTYCISFENN